jgi:hypothetical protein
VKKVAKKKTESDAGSKSVLRSMFRSFAQLAEQAGEGRPLLKGLRVAHDPTTERIVVVHSGARVEFLMVLPAESNPSHANVECRRVSGTGTTETLPIATFQFDETGKVLQSTVPELVGNNVSGSDGAWSIVWAVIWGALQS